MCRFTCVNLLNPYPLRWVVLLVLAYFTDEEPEVQRGCCEVFVPFYNDTVWPRGRHYTAGVENSGSREPPRLWSPSLFPSEMALGEFFPVLGFLSVK